jgi:hypothetical protein
MRSQRLGSSLIHHEPISGSSAALGDYGYITRSPDLDNILKWSISFTNNRTAGMNTEYHKCGVAPQPGYGVKVYGHYGKPVLVFPAQVVNSMHEDFRMLDACRHFIDSGRIKVFTIDSLDNQLERTNTYILRIGQSAIRLTMLI